MPYLDGTEGFNAGQIRPKTCPLCGGELVTRWVGSAQGWHRVRFQARPLFVCKACNLSVRLSRLPRKALRPTRASARKDAERDHARKVADYERRHPTPISNVSPTK